MTTDLRERLADMTARRDSWRQQVEAVNRQIADQRDAGRAADNAVSGGARKTGASTGHSRATDHLPATVHLGRRPARTRNGHTAPPSTSSKAAGGPGYPSAKDVKLRVEVRACRRVLAHSQRGG